MLVGKTKKLKIPPEVLDCICKHRQRVFSKHRYSPESRLYPLLFVCKEWHDVAERRLYASVSLGADQTVLDEDGEEIELEGEEVCDMFYETVSENSRLASLVRELRLGTKRHERSETELHIELIKECPNVESIEFSGYNGYVLDELKEALAAKENLVSLTISRYGLRDMEGDHFCSRTELFTYLLKWPRLEKIYFQNSSMAYDDDDDDDALPKPSAVAGKCLSLKEVTVREDNLYPIHLKLLSSMAPAMQHVEIRVHVKDIPALQKCIQIWAPTLKHLHLTVNGPGKVKHSITPVCSGLTELRYLNIDSSVIPPSEFVHFTRLESLMYFAPTKDADELVQVIKKKGTLPALRKVTCDHIGSKISPGTIEQLRNACKARGVAFCSSFLTEEETSYYGDSDKEECGRFSDYGYEDEGDFDDDSEDEDDDEEDEEDYDSDD